MVACYQESRDKDSLNGTYSGSDTTFPARREFRPGRGARPYAYRKADIRSSCTNIDTGAYTTGQLTCLVLEELSRSFL
jgi:hypothetical protein